MTARKSNFLKLCFISFSLLTVSCGQIAANTVDFTPYESFFGYVVHLGKANLTDSKYNLDLTFHFDSYKDNKENLTHYYLPYHREYIVYDENNNLVNETSNYEYSSDLYSLVNFIGKEKYFYEEGEFLVLTDLDAVQLSYFDEQVSSLKLLYEDSNDQMHYYFTFEDGSETEIVLSISRDDINHPNYLEDELNEYYSSRRISQDELNVKIENKDDFILLLISDSCSACEIGSEYYYDFYLEYPNIDVFCIYVDDINTSLVSLIQAGYNNQSSNYKHPSYSQYPDHYVTPTNISYVDGVIKNVTLGISKGDQQLLFLKDNYQ